MGVLGLALLFVCLPLRLSVGFFLGVEGVLLVEAFLVGVLCFVGRSFSLGFVKLGDL